MDETTVPTTSETTETTNTEKCRFSIKGRSMLTGVNCRKGILKALASFKCNETNLEGETNERAPITLSLVVDKSGSMQGQKIESVKTTLTFIIKEMSKNDQLSIVEYDDTSKTSLPLTKMDEEGKAQGLAVVSKLQCGTQTNLRSEEHTSEL